MSVPTWAFFDFIGVALASFYRHNPDPALQQLSADEVFPHFIVTRWGGLDSTPDSSSCHVLLNTLQ